jgi:hypothetical protein
LVKADLALTRSYGIPLQELPLMRRGLLERNEGEEQGTFTFTEDEMCLYVRQRVMARDAAAQNRKARREGAS